MRILLLLRGSAGVGKSTWIEKNGLKPYALSADDIRLLLRSPSMTVDGGKQISVDNDRVTWDILFKLLTERMKNGEFTVIDATNSKTSEMNRYKDLCDEYRYRIFCVDFTDVPIEEVKRRNAGREPVKRVPESVIDNMYARFRSQKIPSGIKVIKPDELDSIWMKLFDLSGYKKIHHIGDIHGCYTALKEYFEINGGLKDDEFYIFTGDYVDRGIENVEVLKFLFSIEDKKNVLLMEGNHERHLWAYANDERSKSKEFELITKPQLETSDIDKKEIRKLYRRFGQCAYYKYGDKVFLVTHGGVSTMPENISILATGQMIKGVGGYNESEEIAKTWVETTPENFYQIHGHRNLKNIPTKVNDRVFNLEGRIEHGGYLRCVQVDAEGIHIVEVKNNVYKSEEDRNDARQLRNSPIADVIISLRSNKYVNEKQFGNISSFNFSSKAFEKRIWNDQTIKARGLYIDTTKGKVVARSYDKFFYIGEQPNTGLDEGLRDMLQFPVTAYVKENGFLGIVSYNEYTDDLFISTKGSMDGDYADWLTTMLYEKVSSENLVKMKEFAKENNVSFVFECVDMKHDPHVIEYAESNLYLLDIIKNNMDCLKYPYSEMQNIAYNFGLTPKEEAYKLNTWQEFIDWYYEVVGEDYKYKGYQVEGFVVEDVNGYMLKVKTAYYNFWKYMRTVAVITLKNGYITKTSALTTPTANEFYGYLKKLHDESENVDVIPQNICTLRKMFYESKGRDNNV